MRPLLPCLASLTLVTLVVLVPGCGVATPPGAEGIRPRPGAMLTARAFADEREYADDLESGPAAEFPPGWGLRCGMTTFFGENTRDVPPRPVLGGYYHFKETDSSRMEIAMELAPDLSNLGDNRYLIIGGRYIRFVGDAGSAFWKAGGGGILEMRGGDTDLFGLVEAGGGAWLELGEKRALVLGVMLQKPLGGELNAPLVLALQVGLEFF